MDGGPQLGRIAMKIENGGFAACVFSRELLFVRMNGNHAVPRLLGFIENEAVRLAENLPVKMEQKRVIGLEFFQEWTERTEWGLKK